MMNTWGPGDDQSPPRPRPRALAGAARPLRAARGGHARGPGRQRHGRASANFPLLSSQRKLCIGSMPFGERLLIFKAHFFDDTR